MSFLLDTNICSAHVRRPADLAHRFMQHSGRLYIATIVLGELHAWAHRRKNRDTLLQAIDDELLQDVQLLDYDRQSATEFGKLRATLLNQGIGINAVDVDRGRCAATRTDFGNTQHERFQEHSPTAA